MKKLLFTMFVALLLVGCDGTDRVGRELREGFSRKHNKGSAEQRRQAVLAELEWVEESNATELVLDYYTNTQDLTPLKGLTKLKKLSLMQCGITDVTPLAGLTNLERLGLAVNKITDLTPLAELTNLKDLNLSTNQITDVSPLTGLRNLESLDISSNQITDLSPLSQLANLKSLRLSNMPITDLTPLERLHNLKSLDLAGCHTDPFTDFTPLKGLTNLNRIIIGTKLWYKYTDEQREMLRKFRPRIQSGG